MYVTVYLLIFANVNIIAGRNIVLKGQNIEPTEPTNDSKKGMDPTSQKNLEQKHLRNLIDHAALMNSGNEEDPTRKDFIAYVDPVAQVNSRYQINPTTQKDPTEQMDSTTPIGSIRRLDPSDQMRPKMPAITRQGNMERTTERYRTTSEDLLRWLLKQKLPTNHPAPEQIGQLPLGIMLPVTQPLWIFEDYDDTSSKSDVVKDEFQDCEGQRVRCTQDTENSIPVCVTDLSISFAIPWQARQKGFQSYCEVEYRNCLKRYERTGKYYAEHYSEDYLEFLHYFPYFPAGTCS